MYTPLAPDALGRSVRGSATLLRLHQPDPMVHPRPMRIRFPDADDAREKKQRAQTLRAIDAWWKALASKVGELDALFTGKKKWDLPKFMHTKLGAIDRRLMWEFGRALSKTRTAWTS